MQVSAGRRPSCVAAQPLRCEAKAIRSCSSRVTAFSLAIFSADWPIVRPVDGSAMAGASGTRSRGRTRASEPRRAPSDLAFCVSTRMRAMRRLCRIGTSERLSAPPAIPTST